MAPCKLTTRARFHRSLIEGIAGACVLFIALIIPPTLAPALNNPGSTGNPSQADLDVDLTVATLFRISGINDLTFGSYTGTGSLALDDDVCVWTNTDGGGYRVTAKGNGAAFAFTVSKTGDASKLIPYTVRWNTQSGTVGNSPLTANVTSGNLSGANTSSSSCSTGAAATANFQVNFAQADLLGVPSGVYTGTLTLVISAPT